MNGEQNNNENSSYQTRPKYRQKASVNTMREKIKKVLETELHGCTYNVDQATAQTKKICDEVKESLKEMNLARYKYVVQVVIGEQRGEGVRMGSRCFWDPETDNVANETYVNLKQQVEGHSRHCGASAIRKLNRELASPSQRLLPVHPP